MIELAPIKETPADFDGIEAEIMRIFREEIYLPLMKDLGQPRLVANADTRSALIQAIQSGRIHFDGGYFRGQFNIAVAKELDAMRATWDRKEKAYRIPLSLISDEVRSAIDASRYRFEKMAKKVDDRLSQILPEKIAEKVKLKNLFETTLYKVDRRLQHSLKGITVAPQLTDSEKNRIAEEYTNNLQLYIKDWTEKEIVDLRKQVQKSSLSGSRYESLVKTIQKSYGVGQRKAKFLARQETSLMITKFKQTRYEDAGVTEYRWACVAGSVKHPVRPMHFKLKDKVFKWSNPPITDDKGNRNNPGQDYNCRCFAKPIVRFHD